MARITTSVVEATSMTVQASTLLCFKHVNSGQYPVCEAVGCSHTSGVGKTGDG